MSKVFGINEHKIINYFQIGQNFNMNGKKYKVVNVGKPTSKTGEPKTDIYVEGIDENYETIELKISFKQINHEFLENKISSERAAQIFGDNWSKIITNSILTIRNKFLSKKLIYKKKYMRTEEGCITLGWKFELLNVLSGNLSGKLILTDEQLLDVYAGYNLSPDKRNAKVNGTEIIESGVANYILLEGEYSSANQVISNLVSINDYIKRNNNIYFACKALNYRSYKAKYDGDRPLAVYVNWTIENNKLKSDIIFDKPLELKGDEVCMNLKSALSFLNIVTTKEIESSNVVNDDIIYEE